jgi:hypothetical protein
VHRADDCFRDLSKSQDTVTDFQLITETKLEHGMGTVSPLIVRRQKFSRNRINQLLGTVYYFAAAL